MRYRVHGKIVPRVQLQRQHKFQDRIRPVDLLAFGFNFVDFALFEVHSKVSIRKRPLSFTREKGSAGFNPAPHMCCSNLHTDTISVTVALLSTVLLATSLKVTVECSHLKYETNHLKVIFHERQQNKEQDKKHSRKSER